MFAYGKSTLLDSNPADQPATGFGADWRMIARLP